MSSPNVKVQYRSRIHTFNLEAIQNVETLRLAVSLIFDLPKDYELYFEGHALTDSDLRTIIQSKQGNEMKLLVLQKVDDSQMEFLIRDVSEIQIRKSDVNEAQLEFDNEKCKEEIKMEQEKMSFLKKKNEEMLYSQAILNKDVQCNGCFAFPIHGVIYKCLICMDFDLCSKCEETKHHFHPMLKVTKKHHYPLHLKVLFSKESKKKIQKLAQLDKINEQRRKRLKYQHEVQDYNIIDPSTLKSKKVCAKNFLSQIIDKVS